MIKYRQISKLRIVSILLLIVVYSTDYQAQAGIPGVGPFDITNSSGCHLELRWDVTGPGPCTGSPPNCLGSNGTISLTNSTTLNITTTMISTSCSSFACEVYVTILGTSWGGLFTNPIVLTSQSSNGSQTEYDCNGNPHTYSWTITPTGIIIN